MSITPNMCIRINARIRANIERLFMPYRLPDFIKACYAVINKYPFIGQLVKKEMNNEKIKIKENKVSEKIKALEKIINELRNEK